MDIEIKDISNFDFGPPKKVAAVGGSRTFAQTVIAWVPSDTQPAVKVSVSMGGAVIKEQTLTPNSNQTTYYGVSGDDTSKGKINASFGPEGKSGSLYGDLSWAYQGDPGRYVGFIGSWSV